MARLDPADRPVADGGASGSEEAVFRERARRLGLPFTTAVRIAPGTVTRPDIIARGTIARPPGATGPAYIAPDEDDLDAVAGWLAEYPGARWRLNVSTPTAIRAALRRAGEENYRRRSLARLASVDRHFSAERTTTWPQFVIALICVATVAAGLVAARSTTLIVLNLTAAAFFLGVAMLRFIAASLLPPHLPTVRYARLPAAGALPIYTVLVPLHHEAHIVPQLVAALDRIAWPAERLDIKLIVEADDRPTRRAAERFAGAPPYEVVVVPGGKPQTKPRALQYAMTFARGSFVTIYDAEDLPHPHQIAEAYHHFSHADDRLACLQAPLVIDNAEAGIIPRLFALEYASLFDGLLPALSTLGLPLPLGGTSNHFRREALDRVGGWDPFNLTEDADLGIRLARFGYRSEMLTLPTYEEAPATLGIWLKQRTRWFKGWMQCWLVHMRQPVRLVREIGWRQFIGFNLIGAGMIVSALLHPFCLLILSGLILQPLAFWEGGNLFSASVIGVNIFNLFAGYLAMTVLSARAIALRNGTIGMSMWLLVPSLMGYWLLMALACLRALWQLSRQPHLWEKTPHRGRARG